MASIYRIMVINRAGSLIFDWENRKDGFQLPNLTANDKISLASVFYGLCKIATQLSPIAKSSGIELLETTQFRLQCFQSITCVKFVAISAISSSQNIDTLLRKLYELYADFALKNPFYPIDMPIRAEKFDEAVRQLVDKHEKINPVIAI